MLEHAFKLYEQILDRHLHEVVDIDNMKYRLMQGRGTVGAVFVLRKLTEKFSAKNKLFLHLLTWKRLCFEFINGIVIWGKNWAILTNLFLFLHRSSYDSHLWLFA